MVIYYFTTGFVSKKFNSFGVKYHKHMNRILVLVVVFECPKIRCYVFIKYIMYAMYIQKYIIPLNLLILFLGGISGNSDSISIDTIIISMSRL